MPDPIWPVEFVDDTGATHLAHDMAGAWGLVYGGCLLKRAGTGLPFKVAQPARAESPREVTSWREVPRPAADDPAAAEVPDPGPRRSRRKEKS